MMQATKTLMALSFAGAVLAASATPTLARSHHARAHYGAYGAVTPFPGFVPAPYARFEGRRGYHAYNYGRSGGWDPDPRIREELRRDSGDNE